MNMFNIMISTYRTPDIILVKQQLFLIEGYRMTIARFKVVTGFLVFVVCFFSVANAAPIDGKPIQVRYAKAKISLYETSNYSDACTPAMPAPTDAEKLVCSFEKMIPVKTETTLYMPAPVADSASIFEFCTTTVLNQVVRIRTAAWISYIEKPDGQVNKIFGAGFAFPDFNGDSALLGSWPSKDFQTQQLDLNNVTFNVRTPNNTGGFTCGPTGPEFNGPVARYRMNVEIEDHLNLLKRAVR